MNWTRTTSYAETSDCGRYTVAAAKTVGGRWSFQAWRVAGVKLLHTGTSAECKAACEMDAKPIPETDLSVTPDVQA